MLAAGRPPLRILNRELSWLDFNARVLALAEDRRLPLLERLKFCAIFSTNLDEFFMVRVAGLKDLVAGQVSGISPDGRSPAVQLLEIRDRVEELLARQTRVFLEDLQPELGRAGIEVTSWEDLDRDDRKALETEFHDRVFPVLTPLGVDPSHPFPYISNLALNLGVFGWVEGDEAERFARVKVPSLLPRFMPLPDGGRFVPLEQVIARHLEVLFPGVGLVGAHAFRVTRNADLTLEDEEADDLLAALEMELRRRRFKNPVRLEVAAGMPQEMLDLLTEELEVDEEDVYRSPAPLDLSSLWALVNLDRPDLRFAVLSPGVEPKLVDDDEGDVFTSIRRGDVLVHHPYVSFTSSVEAFVTRAASDPRVLAIKMTLYRTSGDSPIIDALVQAAEDGKQVAVLVELTARFDERNNIDWAKRLEQSGVHVVYGMVGLKTHAKVTLVVRDDGDGLRRYCHIGTGNYDSRTARIYEDLGLFTTDPTIAADVTNLFNHLTGFGHEPRYQRLLVAPHALRRGILDLIEGEQAAGPDGRIVLKMNSLVDPSTIEALYEASEAGVDIDLIIRGICCLVPGVPGQSERIRVRSLVGRYLEHSRIYHFANGDGPGRSAWYIGSADLMPRNLDRRVEALVPVVEPSLQARLREVIDVNLVDDTLAWRLGADGSWSRVAQLGEDGASVSGDVEAHVRLHELVAGRQRAKLSGRERVAR
ncbi:MAG: polyphosphate kinase 1 [Acidimicrobiia bacterium]|nr:polyphosphate kinase 1 [Acidimicrobiia bacterium]